MISNWQTNSELTELIFAHIFEVARFGCAVIGVHQQSLQSEFEQQTKVVSPLHLCEDPDLKPVTVEFTFFKML